MARGYPAFWSAVVGGAVASLGQATRAESSIPEQLGLLVIGFGGVIFLFGLFVQLRAPGKPTATLNPDKAITYSPTQRIAAFKITIGLISAGVGGYGVFTTQLPYAYPGLLLLFGGYQLGAGLHRYWANSLTTYYIDSTSGTFLKEYRFIGRESLPAQKGEITQVPTRQGRIERLFGIGQAQIVLKNSKITVRDIPDLDRFRRQIQPLLP